MSDPAKPLPPNPPPELLPPLSERHRRFAIEYAIDMNGRAAAIRAGYARGKAAARASELIRRPAVMAAIRDEMKAREARMRLSGDRIMLEAMRLAFADPSRFAHWGPDGIELVDSDDLTPDDRAAVKWVSVGGRKGATAQRFALHDKLKALELLARMTGVLTREGGRGRFALLAETPEEAAAKERKKAETYRRFTTLVNAKAVDLAWTYYQDMKAAEAAGVAIDDHTPIDELRRLVKERDAARAAARAAQTAE